MKKVFYFIAFSFFLISCSQTDEPNYSDLYFKIDIVHDFQNDSVIVTLDDEILLDSRITTNWMLMLAWSSSLKKLTGDDHTLQLDIIEFGVNRNFDLISKGDTTTALFYFNRENQQVHVNYVKGLVRRY